MFHDLVRLCKTLHDRLRTELEPHGIHRGQCRILHFLAHHGPVTQVEIARHLMLRRATVTRMLQRMERDGMIRRDRKPGDERAIQVILTSRGRHSEQVAFKARNTIEEVVTTVLSDKEQHAFREYLNRISAALNPDPAAPIPCTDTADTNTHGESRE